MLGVSLPSVYQARKVRGNIFLCFKGIATKPVPSQESERSYICVLGVSLPSLNCTKPGTLDVIYLCFRGIVTKPVPSQESEMSYICVLGVSLPSLYHTRRVRGHIFVF